MTASPDFHAHAPETSCILDGKYRLDARLGEGAVGIVYRATHLGLKKVFALKLLKPGPALAPPSVARFQREAEALGRLRHPHGVGALPAPRACDFTDHENPPQRVGNLPTPRRVAPHGRR